MMNNRVYKSDRQYFVFIVLFYFFLLRDWLEQYFGFVAYGDELIALFAIPVFIVNLRNHELVLKIKKSGFGVDIVLFIFIGLIGNLVFEYQDFWKVAVPDAFLNMKFWLALYLGKNIFSRISIEKYAVRMYRHVKLVTSVYVIFYLIDQIFHIFDASIRYGMRSTQLMYSHPTVFTACCVYLIGVLIMVSEYNTGWKMWLVILLFLMCTTLRGKAMGGAMLIALICYFVFFRKKKIKVRTMLLFIPVVVALGWEQIYYYFFSSIQSGSARYQLLVKSFSIAKDHFPFGAGFGTYASHYSGIYYSLLYEIYGLAGIQGLTKGHTSFISDSFWPMILGQTGVVGLLLFLLVLWKLFKSIQKLRKNNLGMYASAMSMFSYLLVASMAESAFVHPLMMSIAVMLGFLLGKMTKLEEKKI